MRPLSTLFQSSGHWTILARVIRPSFHNFRHKAMWPCFTYLSHYRAVIIYLFPAKRSSDHFGRCHTTVHFQWFQLLPCGRLSAKFQLDGHRLIALRLGSAISGIAPSGFFQVYSGISPSGHRSAMLAKAMAISTISALGAMESAGRFSTTLVVAGHFSSGFRLTGYESLWLFSHCSHATLRPVFGESSPLRSWSHTGPKSPRK